MAPTYVKSKNRDTNGADRTAFDLPFIVRDVISDIRNKGDAAVRSWSEKFDRRSPPTFKLSTEEIKSIISGVPKQTVDDTLTVQENVRHFALAQRKTLRDMEMEIRPGVYLGPEEHTHQFCRSRSYILGKPISSARLCAHDHRHRKGGAAGVPRVLACTPPIKGEVPPATVAAAYFAGADEIWILGGVQAIAAMAIGTGTIIGKVDFVAGPCNYFVAEAKRQLFGEIGIDLTRWTN